MNRSFSMKSVQTKKVVNSEQLDFEGIINNLENWKIPKVSTSVIYKEGRFSMLMNYSIKTIEQTIPLAKEYETLKMFSKSAILKHQQKYTYLHLRISASSC